MAKTFYNVYEQVQRYLKYRQDLYRFIFPQLYKSYRYIIDSREPDIRFPALKYSKDLTIDTTGKVDLTAASYFYHKGLYHVVDSNDDEADIGILENIEVFRDRWGQMADEGDPIEQVCIVEENDGAGEAKYYLYYQPLPTANRTVTLYYYRTPPYWYLTYSLTVSLMSQSPVIPETFVYETLGRHAAATILMDEGINDEAAFNLEMFNGYMKKMAEALQIYYQKKRPVRAFDDNISKRYYI